MEWLTNDSSLGRLWVRLQLAWEVFLEWVKGKSQPSPLKSFTAKVEP
jgi:hypothetical protein